MDSESSDEQTHVRPATEGDALFLTELALRSKGHWEYDSEFLQDCRADLTITPEFVSSNVVFVIEEKGNTIGFYSLERQVIDDVELVHMFVEPHSIGRGYGKQLLRHAAENARQLGFKSMIIKSDPYAEPFYKAMGATRIGEVESATRPDRMLPLLQITFPSRNDDCELGLTNASRDAA